MIIITRDSLNLVLESVCFTNLCDWIEKDRVQDVLNIVWTHGRSSLKHLDYILFV